MRKISDLFQLQRSPADQEVSVTSASSADGLLTQFLAATNVDMAQRIRDRLVIEIADPLLRQIIRRKLHLAGSITSKNSWTHEEAESNLYFDALEALMRQMDRWREGTATAPPPDRFDSYVAVVAYNAWNQWARKHCPRLATPEAQIHYLLTRHKNFALWEIEPGVVVGGLAAWRQDRRLPAAPATRQRMLNDPEGFMLCEPTTGNQLSSLKNFSAVRLLTAILEQAGAPVEIDILAAVFAEIRGRQPALRETPLTSSEETTATTSYPDVANAAPSALAVVRQDHLDFLRRLWPEVLRLPLEQRQALLLNLRDGDIHKLPELRIATFEEIAAALDQTAAELAQIWYRLPLADADVAARIGHPQQKVHELRASAYRTLAWRLRPFDRAALCALWETAITMNCPLPAILMLHLRDAQGFSILALLNGKSVATVAEIATVLSISVARLKEIWPNLPLSLPEVGSLLQMPPHEALTCYREACEQLQEQLALIWGDY